MKKKTTKKTSAPSAKPARASHKKTTTNKVGKGTPNLPGRPNQAKIPTNLSIAPPKLQLKQSASPEEMNNYQSAAVFIQALAANAGQWQQELPEGFRPAVLALLNGGIQVNVTSMAQVSFHGIQIEGTLDGGQCSILAHQSTIQELCFAEEIVPEIAKRPIGFVWSDGETEI